MDLTTANEMPILQTDRDDDDDRERGPVVVVFRFALPVVVVFRIHQTRHNLMTQKQLIRFGVPFPLSLGVAQE